jgi:hypothetical protein
MRAEDSGLTGPTQLVHSSSWKERSISRNELRRLVVVMVDILREMNLPPEKVLVVVKAVVRDGISPHIARYVDDAGHPEDRGNALIEDAAKWCIESYFSPHQDKGLVRAD